MKVYLEWEKPISGWISTLEEDKREVEDNIKHLQDKLGADIELIDGGIVKNLSDVKKLSEKLNGIDGILVLKVTTFFSASVFTEILNFNLPTILFCSFPSGSGWPELLDVARNSSKKVDYVFGSDYNEIVKRIKLIDVIHRLKETKILVICKTIDENYVKKAKEKFGVEIKRMNFQQLRNAYDSVNLKQAEIDASEWIANAERVIKAEVPREEIVKSSRLYLGIKELLRKEEANGIAIDCLGGFTSGLIPAYSCLAFSKLDNEGLIGTCQADLNSALTKVIIGYIAEKPGFVSDPEIDTSTNLMLHYHCTAPTKMNGPSGINQPYIIRNHGGDNKGVALQVKMRIGQKITMAKLVELNKMLISTGEIVGNTNMPNICRTQFTVKVENAKKMLDGWAYEDHRVIFYGDYIDEVESISKLLNFRLVREG